MLKKTNKDFTFGDLPKVTTLKTESILVEGKLVKVSADVSEDLREGNLNCCSPRSAIIPLR